MPGCRGLWPRTPSPPAQAAAREKPGCPRWLVAPPPTHTDSPGCQHQLALLFKACDGEFRHWNPPARQHTSHKPMDEGCQKGQRPASCLGVVLKGLHRRGSPSSGSQKARACGLPASLCLRCPLTAIPTGIRVKDHLSQSSASSGEGPKATLDSVLLRRAWSRLRLWVKARDSEAPGLPGGLANLEAKWGGAGVGEWGGGGHRKRKDAGNAHADG